MLEILLVDDEPSFLDMSKEYLEDLGFRVTTCTSAVKAMKEMDIEVFDAVVSDYQMPDFNGLDFLSALRSKGIDTPFILFTGKGREEVALEALNQGADFYLKKGGDPRSQFTELRNMIEHAANRVESERAVQYNARKFRALLENSSDLIFTIDEDGLIRYVSPSVEHLLGYRPEDLSGAPVHELVVPDEGDRVAHLVRGIHHDGVVERQTLRFGSRDGPMRILECVFSKPTEVPGDLVVLNAWDITSRWEMERTLRQERELLDQVMNTGPISIVILDREGRITFANTEAQRLLGISADGSGRTFHHPDWRITSLDGGEFPEEELPFSVVMGTGRPVRDVRHAISGPGGKMYLSINAAPILGDEGEVELVVAIINDITQSLRLERQLRDSESTYRTIFETTGAATILIEEDTTLSLVNEEFTRLIGYSKEEAEGEMTSMDLVAEWERDRLLDYHRRRREGESDPPRQYEFDLVTKEGKVKRCYITISLIPGTGRSIASLLDITELRDAERALREKSGEQEMLLDVIDSQVWYVEEPERYGKVNRARADFLGRTKEEVEGASIWDCWPREEAERCVEGNRHVFREKEPLLQEEWITNWEGEPRLMKAHKIPVLDHEGKVKHVVCSAHDITEYRRTRDALENANHKLNLLDATTRHDILNQLTVAIGYLDLAKGKEGEKASDHLSRIDESLRRIREELEFNREYMRMGAKSPQWVDLHRLIEGIAQVHGPVIRNQTGRYLIMADPMIEKALRNLVDNSIRHGGGVSEISIWTEEEGDLHLVVEDDGRGIPEGEKERIFEYRYGHGGGRGLHLAREILSITGMGIEESGTLGKGAKFVIRISPQDFRYQGS
ncbi:MAG: PAS domain S-box protein [Methanomassiliicoccales archaeon]